MTEQNDLSPSDLLINKQLSNQLMGQQLIY